MDVVALIKFYLSSKPHYCYHLLTQRILQAHFHCLMRLLHHRQSAILVPDEILFYFSKFMPLQVENYILLRETQFSTSSTCITRIQMSDSRSATLWIHSLPHPFTAGKLQIGHVVTANAWCRLVSVFKIFNTTWTYNPPTHPCLIPLQLENFKKKMHQTINAWRG
jgi:hypothetical protein